MERLVDSLKGNKPQRGRKTKNIQFNVRSFDDLGRLVIPKDIRKTSDIEAGCELEIFVDGGNIILEKYKRKCVFCYSSMDTIEFREKVLCRECFENLNNL